MLGLVASIVAVGWTYNDAAAWDGACSGDEQQSPIDLASSGIGAPSGALPPTFAVHDARCSAPFQLSPEGTEVVYSTECRGTAAWGGGAFALHRLGLHSPSEHTVDGGHFPMEVQLIHTDGDGKALVISLLVAVGTPNTGAERAAASWLRSVVTAPPGAPAAAHAAVLRARAAAGGFAVYNGSLTVPPCDGGAVWLVATAPLVVEQSTLALYRASINARAEDGRLARSEVPRWGAAAGAAHASFEWNAALGANNRKTQPLSEFHEVRYVGPPAPRALVVENGPFAAFLFVIAALTAGQLAQFAFSGHMKPKLPESAPVKFGGFAVASGGDAHAKKE